MPQVESKARNLYGYLLLVCVVLSASGILIAAFVTKNPIDGERGGTLAVGLDIMYLFLNPEYGNKIYRILRASKEKLDAFRLATGGKPQTDRYSGILSQINDVRRQIDDLKQVVKEIDYRLDESAKGQEKQNVYFALATGIGAFTSAFGDLIAQCLMETCCWHRFASVILVGLSPWSGFGYFLTARCSDPHAKLPSQPSMTDRCVVDGLPELVPPNAQYPSVCLDPLIDRFQKDQPILILLVGRTDKRQLNSDGRRIYNDNFTLGYQRAVSMRDYLLKRYKAVSPQKMPLTSDEFARRIVVLTGGPGHINAKTSKSDMSEDRCVEVFVYWNSKPNLEKSGP